MAGRGRFHVVMKNILSHKDTRWIVIWITGCLLLLLWDILFLNRPAFNKVITGFFNTFVIALLVVLFSLFLGWMVTLLLHSLSARSNKAPYFIAAFFLNLIRSVPQIVGVLFAYVAVTLLVERSVITSQPLIMAVMAVCISVFIFLELVDLMRDRIDHFAKLDFYSAMRVCGVPERRIVNFDILWKNSRLHILNKLIAVLGYAVFLQCSVDFIISVGLTTDVSETALPSTLGSLLAAIDSKQDILAVGYTLTHPGYAGHLLFEHLQGMTVAFCIVFSLVSIYHIANGYAERHRL
jgi:ABC-type dipeptide/oligopeptide/nickel transport system permease subunit